MMRGGTAAGGRLAPCLMPGCPPSCTPPPGSSSSACWDVEPAAKCTSKFLSSASLYVRLASSGLFSIQPTRITTYQYDNLPV